MTASGQNRTSGATSNYVRYAALSGHQITECLLSARKRPWISTVQDGSF
jgi:hypothetical protein